MNRYRWRIGSVSRLRLSLIVFIAFWVSSEKTSFGREPDWQREILARGRQAERIRSQEIIHRPYRPFHFYGNTIRRLHYRGSGRPTANDIRRSFTVLTNP